RIEFRKVTSRPVDGENVPQAACIEVEPTLNAIAVKLLSLNCEAIWRQRSQKNTVKLKAKVLVDNLCDPVKAALGGSHQGPDAIRPEEFPCPPDALHRQLVAVSAGPWPVLVMQVGRPIKRGGQLHVVGLAEDQMLICEQCQIGRDDEIQLFPRRRCGCFCGQYDLFN